MKIECITPQIPNPTYRTSPEEHLLLYAVVPSGLLLSQDQTMTDNAAVGTITCGVAGAVEGAVTKTVAKGSGTVARNALKKLAA